MTKRKGNPLYKPVTRNGRKVYILRKKKKFTKRQIDAWRYLKEENRGGE